MGRKDYDPRAEATAMLNQLRDALAATALVEPGGCRP